MIFIDYIKMYSLKRLKKNPSRSDCRLHITVWTRVFLFTVGFVFVWTVCIEIWINLYAEPKKTCAFLGFKKKCSTAIYCRKIILILFNSFKGFSTHLQMTYWFKSSDIYLYSAFHNTDCIKAPHGFISFFFSITLAH